MKVKMQHIKILWDAVKVAFRGKFLPLSVHVKTEEKSQISY